MRRLVPPSPSHLTAQMRMILNCFQIRQFLPNGIKIIAKLQNRSSSMTPNVIAALGGTKVFGARAARVDLLEETERGLPVRAYEILAEALHLTPEEEDRLLQVSLRTRARWSKRARLDVSTSDRLVRLARIFALAIWVLESRDNAAAWLREPSSALGGRSPLAAIVSDPGAEKVSNMLYQMEHGVYA
jgi:putative toxin-antitoxin system antitoxin component (TIGR02293 family)